MTPSSYSQRTVPPPRCHWLAVSAQRLFVADGSAQRFFVAVAASAAAVALLVANRRSVSGDWWTVTFCLRERGTERLLVLLVVGWSLAWWK